MGSKASREPPRRNSTRIRRPTPVKTEEEQILKKAQIYLLFEAQRPLLWSGHPPGGSQEWTTSLDHRRPPPLSHRS